MFDTLVLFINSNLMELQVRFLTLFVISWYRQLSLILGNSLWKNAKLMLVFLKVPFFVQCFLSELSTKLQRDLQGTVNYGRRWLFKTSAIKSQLVSFDCSNSCGIVYTKMDGSGHDKKMLGLCFTSYLGWGFNIVSNRLQENWSFDSLYFMKPLSPEIALCKLSCRNGLL